MATKKTDPNSEMLDYEQEFSRTAVKNKPTPTPDPLDDESTEEEVVVSDPDEEIEQAEPQPAQSRMVKPASPEGMDEEEDEVSARPAKTFERPAPEVEEDTYISPQPIRPSRESAPAAHQVEEVDGGEHNLDDLAKAPTSVQPEEDEAQLPKRRFDLDEDEQPESYPPQARFSPVGGDEAPPVRFRTDDEEPSFPPQKFGQDDSVPQIRQRMPASGIYSSHNKQAFPQDEYAPMNSKYGPNRGGRKSGSWLHVIILALIGVAVIGTTVYLLKNQFASDKVAEEPKKQEAPVPTEAPTPTPTPEAKRADFKVRVLNGTGKSGLAGTVMEKLKGLGYQSDKTGNATSTEKTTIKVKEGQELMMQTLIKDLSPDYEASGEATLKASDAADAEVVLGGTED